MWDDDRDGRREHEGLARVLDESGAPDGRIWNGHAWQEWDFWSETRLVTFPLPPAGRLRCAPSASASGAARSTRSTRTRRSPQPR
ncbi:hypothetical protein ABCR94_13380 [Streptomyces sp. 21So2-11]|uniref:hypothetical protein n=1 Tax=Streptomyces sp. 21So2-11 TaxID=3144408 RepID=UPI00321AA392